MKSITVTHRRDWGRLYISDLRIEIYFDTPHDFHAFRALTSTDAELRKRAISQHTNPALGLIHASLLPHELRHFHDSLVMSLPLYILMHRIQSAAKSLALVTEMLDRQDVDVIPLPLLKWFSMPQLDRRMYARLWASQLGVDPSRILNFSKEFIQSEYPSQHKDISQILESVSRSHFEIASASIGISREKNNVLGTTPADIIEMSALNVQIDHVDRYIGHEYRQALLEMLYDMDVPGYVETSVPTVMLGGRRDMNLLPCIAFWSLSGDYRGPLKFACPVGRYYMLIHELSENRRFYIDNRLNPIDMLALWDKKLNTTPWQTALLYNKSCLEGLARGIEAALPQDVVLVEFLDSLLSIQNKLIDVLKRDADAFIDLVRYSELMKELPATNVVCRILEPEEEYEAHLEKSEPKWRLDVSDAMRLLFRVTDFLVGESFGLQTKDDKVREKVWRDYRKKLINII